MTSEEHNKYLGWTFLGYGGLHSLLLILMMVFFGIIFSTQPGPGPGAPPREFMAFMLTFLFVFQMLFIVPSFIAAYALTKQKPWARAASITAAAIAALNVPLGTAVCGYAMWFFLSDRWKELYGPELNHDSTESRQLIDRLEERWSGMTTDEKGNVSFHPVEPPDWR